MRILTSRTGASLCLAGVATAAFAAPALAAPPPADPGASSPQAGVAAGYQQPSFTVTYSDDTCSSGSVTLSGLDPRVTWVGVGAIVAGVTGQSSAAGGGLANPAQIKGGSVTVPFESSGRGTVADTLVITAGPNGSDMSQASTRFSAATTCATKKESGKGQIVAPAKITSTCAGPTGAITLVLSNNSTIPVTVNASLTDGSGKALAEGSRSASHVQAGQDATLVFPDRAAGEYVVQYSVTSEGDQTMGGFQNSYSIDVVSCTVASASAAAATTAAAQPAATAAAQPAANPGSKPGLANTGSTK